MRTGAHAVDSDHHRFRKLIVRIHSGSLEVGCVMGEQFSFFDVRRVDMARGGRAIDRDPEKPPRGERGTGDEPGSVWLDRFLTRLVLGESTMNEDNDGSTPEGAIDRDPEKPPPEESGVWNKRGSRTVDRIVEFVVPR